MEDSVFNGEFWNVDTETSDITRFQFSLRGDRAYVVAWGSCFPQDCEWGETELHLLDDDDAASNSYFAFATWEFDPDPTHCFFTMTQEELTVIWISIQSDALSFKRTLAFRKDTARSAAARNPDRLAKFKHMWDGSEPGWKLIQYTHPVFLIELNFDESGPSRHEIPVIKEFIDPFPSEPTESDDKTWERLRDCSGVGRAKPLGPTEMNRLRTVEREIDLDLNVCVIDPSDYLTLDPDGNHYAWIAFPSYRRPVIDRMIQAGVPIISSKLE